MGCRCSNCQEGDRPRRAAPRRGPIHACTWGRPSSLRNPPPRATRRRSAQRPVTALERVGAARVRAPHSNGGEMQNMVRIGGVGEGDKGGGLENNRPHVIEAVQAHAALASRSRDDGAPLRRAPARDRRPPLSPCPHASQHEGCDRTSSCRVSCWSATRPARRRAGPAPAAPATRTAALL